MATSVRGTAMLAAAVLALCALPVRAADPGRTEDSRLEDPQLEDSGLPELGELLYLPGQDSAEREDPETHIESGDPGEILLRIETLPPELWAVSQEEALKYAQSSGSTEGSGGSVAADSADAETGAPQISNTAEAVSGEEEEGAVVVHLTDEVGDPDPFRIMDTGTASLLRQISEGLVVLDADGEPVPGSAEKWKVSEDGLKWTFTLREDLCWADGEPMTAEDFADLFRKAADPAEEALYGSDLAGNIEGYEEVRGGDSTAALSVKAESGRKLVVRLREPDPDFAEKCASWTLLPIRELIRGDTGDTVFLDWAEITGNGPYYIADLEPGKEYLLKKNPWYRGGSADAAGEQAETGETEKGSAVDPDPSGTETDGGQDAEPFEAVRWRISGDLNEEYSDFLNGEVQALALVPERESEESAFAGEYLQEQVIPDALGITFNCRNEALAEPLVREALSSVIDREYIAGSLLGGGYVPAESSDASETGQSAGRAKELLTEAGFKDGKEFPVLTCVTDEDGGAGRIAEYLASVWRKLGVTVRIETEDADDFAQEKTAGTFDILCGSLMLTSDIRNAELEKFVSTNEENVTGYVSEEFDELMEKAAEDTSPEKYERHLDQAEEVLEEEMPVVPLVMRRVTWLRQEDMEGIFCDLTGCWQLWKKAPETASARRGDGPEEVRAAGSGEEDMPSGSSEEKAAAADEGVSMSADAGLEDTEAGSAGEKNSASDGGEASTVTLTASGDRPAVPLADVPGGSLGADPGAAGTGASGAAVFSRNFDPAAYFRRTDTTAYLTQQAWVLAAPDPEAEQILSLPKYAQIHLVGIGNGGFDRIEQDGRFYYIDAASVSEDEAAVNEMRAKEAEENLRKKLLLVSMHRARESELTARAADVRAETERILEEIAHREKLRTQTRNPNWNGPVLSRSRGSVYGPSGKETYYNLNMSGVVNIMRRMGNTDEYWVRDDGCKMLGDYIMCAANLGVHPRGTLVETSLGTCIVCDTGGFARHNAHQIDIAVTW